MIPMNAGRHITRISADRVPHISPEEYAKKLRDYHPLEHDARLRGIPGVGEGAIFKHSPKKFVVDHIELHGMMSVADGVDIGFTDPTAIVRGFVDELTMPYPMYYIWGAMTAPSGSLPSQIVADFEDSFPKGTRLVPKALPHDADNSEKGTGKTMRAMYQELGWNCLDGFPTYHGSNRVWPMYVKLNDLFRLDRIKIHRSCESLIKGITSTHTKKNKAGRVQIQRVQYQDVLDAFRYVMFTLIANRGILAQEVLPQFGGLYWKQMVERQDRIDGRHMSYGEDDFR